MDKPGITVTVRIGHRGERVESYELLLDPHLVRELTEPMELSDEPLSLMLDSFARHKDTVTVRKRAFKMRRETARLIAAQIVDALYQAFGSGDEVNGYRRGDWSERDKAQADYVRRTGGD